MNLESIETFTFSQSDDIDADIKNGWCAGVTALVAQNVGRWSEELGVTSGDWVVGDAFDTLKSTLNGINNQKGLTQDLQTLLGTVRNKADVTDKLHKHDFNGRGCKVLLSVGQAPPLIGKACAMLWDDKWKINHIGFIVRGDDKLLLFDPNYGAGTFHIRDDMPLTLADLSTALGVLSWGHNASCYYLSNTKPISVIDAGALDLRFTVAEMNRLSELEAFANRFRQDAH